MRSFAFVVLACAGCSSEPSNAAPIFHRDCVTPNVKPCSGLAILTPREPIPLSSVPVGAPLVRGGGIDAFQPPSLLQHYALDGTPPRLHATSNVLLASGLPYGSMVTDGAELFAFGQSAGEDLRIWNAANALTVDVHLSDGDGNQGGVAAYQGLALAHDANYGPTDRLRMYDDQGTLGWSRDGVAGTPYAYGCGFAFAEYAYPNEKVTTLPLDGRASIQQTLRASAPVPWPYDAHALAFVLGETNNGNACGAGLLLAFDDGRNTITRMFGPGCTVAVVPTSFGPVLYKGDTFVLLDSDGNAIGAELEVTLGGTYPTVTLVPGPNAIAVVSTEQVSPSSNATATFETVIGCAP